MDAIRVAGGGDALRIALAAAPDGARIEIDPGHYDGPLVLRRSVTLVGRVDGVHIDAGDKGAALTIEGRANRVELSGLQLVGGHSRAGGGVVVPDGAWLTMRDCRVTGCAAPGRGGGGIWARRGELILERVQFIGNSARTGGAALLTGDVQVRFQDCRFEGNRAATSGGALAVRDRAVVVVQDCHFLDNHAAQPGQGRGTALHVALSPVAATPVVVSGGSMDGGADAAWDEQGEGRDLRRTA